MSLGSFGKRAELEQHKVRFDSACLHLHQIIFPSCVCMAPLEKFDLDASTAIGGKMSVVLSAKKDKDIHPFCLLRELLTFRQFLWLLILTVNALWKPKLCFTKK